MAITFLTNEDKIELEEQIEELRNGGNVDVELSGAVIVATLDKGVEINVDADTTEEVTIFHHGRNYAPPMTTGGAEDGFTYTINGDGTITFNGTANADLTYVNVPEFYLPAGTYYIRTNYPDGYRGGVGLNFNNKGVASGIRGEVEATYTTEVGGMARVYIGVRTGTVFDGTPIYIMVSDQKNAEYEPFVGNSITTSLPHTFNAYDGHNVLYANDGTILTAKTRKSVDVNAVIDEKIAALKEELMRENVDIPDYWDAHLTKKIETIKSLQRDGGKDTYSFVVIADYHRSGNIGKRSPVLIKRVMDECGIKFCLCLGDIQNGGAWSTKALELAEWDEIEKDFEPIRDRTLMIPGNHDGAYGSADMNGDGVISGTTDYYIYNLSQDEIYDLIYRKVGLINGVTFDDSYNGYYVDDPVSKVRYILVNTHYSNGATNKDGTPVNNVMRKGRVGQSQVDMVIDALQSIQNNDWNVVVGMHVPIAELYDSRPSEDAVLLRNVMEAYQNRTTYSGTFGTVGEYDYISVNTDFTNAKGSVSGVFSGHVHADGENMGYAFPIISSQSDQTSAAKFDGVVISGEAGTITEQSFDVFTVNKRTGVIRATKIGYGESRVFDNNTIDTVVTVDLLKIADVNLGCFTLSGNEEIVYYSTTDDPKATLNPVCFYVEAGSTVKMSLSDYSNYCFAMLQYSCDESAKNTDFTFTEKTSKNFGLKASKIYDSSWKFEDVVFRPDEPGVMTFNFRRKDYTTMTDDDTAAIRSLVTATITPPSNKETYTNLANPLSEDWYSESHFLYKGVLTEEKNSYYNKTLFVTNFIPVVKHDVLRFKGIDKESLSVSVPAHIDFYDENKNYLSTVNLCDSDKGKVNGFPNDVVADENGVTAYTILMRGDTNAQFIYQNHCDNVRYARFSAHWATSVDDIIITVNEEIV